jgi:very-short-patch-repair endonuclease
MHHKSPARPDVRVARAAADQWGVLSLAELFACGLSRTAIRDRVRNGRLHPVHCGVYAVGHRRLSLEGRFLAAVKACGAGAVLSHVAAAVLWGFIRWDGRYPEVTVVGDWAPQHPGLRIHRTAAFHRDDRTRHHGIPVTTPARTILDLAATHRQADLEHVLDRNEILELSDYPSLAALARAHPGHRGAHKLLATMKAHDAGTNLTRSGLEVLFRQLCHDHGLPQPHVNSTVAGKEVDFLFEHARLIVETDSWRYHKTRRAFENDRARDVITTAAGYRTLRFTDRRLTNDAHAVAAAIATTLATPDSGPRTKA